MSILNLLGGIPVNANLRIKLAELDQEIATLRSENLALTQENASLKEENAKLRVQIQERDAQIDRLKDSLRKRRGVGSGHGVGGPQSWMGN